MMNIVPFEPDHLLGMDVQDAQQASRRHFEPERLALLAQHNSFTVVADDEPVACFGWIELYPTRALLWSVLSRKSSEHMVAFTRIAKRLVDSLPHRRIEAEVDAQFSASCRWMELLGLECENPGKPLRAYNADGGDAYIYAKVK